MTNTISNDILNLFFVGWTTKGVHEKLCQECFLNALSGYPMAVIKANKAQNPTRDDVFKVTSTDGMVINCESLDAKQKKQFKIGFSKGSNHQLVIIDVEDYVNFLSDNKHESTKGKTKITNWIIGFSKQ